VQRRLRLTRQREVIRLGKPVFPSPTAGRGERIRRTPFRRCIQCGTDNDTRKTAWAKRGEGLKKTAEPGAADDTGVHSTPAVFDVKSGCVFCGSKYWLTSRPKKLPHSRRLPATGWKRFRKLRR